MPQGESEIPAALPDPGLLLPVLSLARREIVRFFRQRNRVIGALLQPLIFWIFFGSAFRASFKPPEGMEQMSYQEYFFPGTIVMILLFTAIFSTISIIEDRREGFLQSVLVAPISRLAMVLGKILGGTFLAVFQGVLFLLLALTMNIPFTLTSFFATLGVMCLVAVALTGLGFMIAWRMDSTQGFHAIMSIFLLPMWLLSGALFPASGVPGWLGALMTINPLTYGLAALRHVMYPNAQFEHLPSLPLSLAVTAAFTVLVIAGSALLAGTRTSGDLH
ncbi:MAG TPA: ABC transporter permease [Planctomycetota bacterium]|nr:ABC transporter permease [Planctomycetota bacterium]